MLGLGLVSGSSLVGVCRHLAAVVSVTYTTVLYTTVVSIVDLWIIHDGRVRNINLLLMALVIGLCYCCILES